MSNLPWIEKYRPKNIDDIIDSSYKTHTLKNLIKNDELPHLLLYGMPGCGKTTMAIAIARLLYGENFKSYVLELNASDDRGIEIVRNVIPEYAKTKSDKIKFIILDEADAMTTEAQGALRRVIEIYSKNCRFCIICNNIHSILPGIQSRCTLMRFNALNNENMSLRLEEIANKENVIIEKEGINAIIESSKDFRQMLNVFQCLASLYNEEKITSEIVYEFTGHVPEKTIIHVIKFLRNNSFQNGFEYLQNNIKQNLWNIMTLIEAMTPLIINDDDIPIEQKTHIIDVFSKIENRLTTGKNGVIYIAMVVAAFK
jgi:replication factor C subunit 3/5